MALTEIMVEPNVGASAEESSTAGSLPKPSDETGTTREGSATAEPVAIEAGATNRVEPAPQAKPAKAQEAALLPRETALEPARDRAMHSRILALLLSIAFVLWAFYAWRGYGARHAQLGESWYVGGVHLIELTLIKEDAVNLACASDTTNKGLHCAFRGDTRTPYPDQSDEKLLKPYYTVKGELLFGAGLWSSPAFKRALPRSRFTAACNYHVVGIMKAASTRWSEKGRFDPLKQSATFGYFTDCILPE